MAYVALDTANSASVVIHYFHIDRPFVCPDKADAPLVVDANAVLALAIPQQHFQPVARRTTQEIQRRCGLQLNQLAFRHILDVGKLASFAAGEQTLCFLAFEGLDRHTNQFYTVYRYSVYLPIRQ